MHSARQRYVILEPILAFSERGRSSGFKFVSEKVSHQPVVMAFHAEAPAWQINGHVAPSQKFWGRSMEVRGWSMLGARYSRNALAGLCSWRL